MSVHVTSPLYKLNLKGEAKAILLVFGDHANPSGSNSFPSLDLVAKEAGFSLRTANRYVKAFRDDGVLQVEDHPGSGRRSVSYSIDLERAKALYGLLTEAGKDLPFSVPGRAPAGKEKCHSDTFPGEKKSATVARQSATVSKEKCHSDTLTIKEPSEPPAAAETPAPADPVEGSADDGSDPAGEQLTTRAHWRSKSAEMETHFKADWATWLRDRIVLKDDGSAMVLGAPSGFITTYCGRFVPDLERILGRKVSIVEFDPKAEAARTRREKARQDERQGAGHGQTARR